VEIFDTKRLKWVGSHSFGHSLGSLTWIDRRDGKWYACFAFYGNRAKEPSRDPRWTQVVEFDQEWRRLQAWTFPAELIEKFGDYSSSGGAFGPDGLLYVTGHDQAELYVVDFPKGGSEFVWLDTIPIESEGQAFAWDDQRPGTFYSILKRDTEVLVSRITNDD
jgi:outer membrane protein assembly factor BamB